MKIFKKAAGSLHEKCRAWIVCCSCKHINHQNVKIVYTASNYDFPMVDADFGFCFKCGKTKFIGVKTGDILPNSCAER